MIRIRRDVCALTKTGWSLWSVPYAGHSRRPAHRDSPNRSFFCRSATGTTAGFKPERRRAFSLPAAAKTSTCHDCAPLRSRPGAKRSCGAQPEAELLEPLLPPAPGWILAQQQQAPIIAGFQSVHSLRLFTENNGPNVHS